MKKIFLAVTLFFLFSTIALGANFAFNINGNTVSAKPKEDKQEINICHATNSVNNPYVQNSPEVNNNGDLKGGHLGHQGSIATSEAVAQALKDNKEEWGDIIPPYDFGDDGHFDGYNWTTEGQAIWNNECEILEPSTTPTVTPDPTVTPTEGPTSTPTPTIVQPTPTVTEDEFKFPSCLNQEGDGDRAHYDSGLHQIYGDGLQEGKDDVYSLEDGNFLQCFCPVNGEGIQTNWHRTSEGNVNGEQWNLGDYQYDAENSNYICNKDNEETPTPTPEVKEECRDVGFGCGGSPSFPHDQGAPQCTDGSTVNLPANVHVVRSGSDATINFFVTQGDGANIYYKESKESDWTHSVLKDEVNKSKNSDNFVSYPIHGLKVGVAYDFGVQQTQGCGGGQTVTAVVIDGPSSQTFGFSYWTWSN